MGQMGKQRGGRPNPAAGWGGGGWGGSMVYILIEQLMREAEPQTLPGKCRLIAQAQIPCKVSTPCPR